SATTRCTGRSGRAVPTGAVRAAGGVRSEPLTPRNGTGDRCKSCYDGKRAVHGEPDQVIFSRFDTLSGQSEADPERSPRRHTSFRNRTRRNVPDISRSPPASLWPLDRRKYNCIFTSTEIGRESCRERGEDTV